MHGWMPRRARTARRHADATHQHPAQAPSQGQGAGTSRAHRLRRVASSGTRPCRPCRLFRKDSTAPTPAERAVRWSSVPGRASGVKRSSTSAWARVTMPSCMSSQASSERISVSATWRGGGEGGEQEREGSRGAEGKQKGGRVAAL